MFIELMEVLRCVRPHEESALVGAFEEVRDREIVTGTLGCPVCQTRYPIRDGVLHVDGGAADEGTRQPSHSAPTALAGAGDVVRLAALLAVAAPGGLVLLGGSWGRLAQPLEELLDVRVVRFAVASELLPAAPGSAFVSARGIPLAAGACLGVALDAAVSNAVQLDATVRVLQPGGRLVAPAHAPLPDGVRELARDERDWVGERVTPPSPLLRLHRSPTG